MFMRKGAGALVEVSNYRMVHNGFHNVATMRGLDYVRVHGDDAGGEWRWHDVVDRL
jgi:hypothetical protein